MDNNIIKLIKRMAEAIIKSSEFQPDEIDNALFYKENLINLSVYKISQLPYFCNRYDFVRVISTNQKYNILKLKTLNSNNLPLIKNFKEVITSDFGHQSEYNVHQNKQKLIILKI
jgi:hypothetical protein